MPESNSSTESALPEGHVIVGRIGKPHGLNGEFFVFPETDHPLQRFAVGARVTAGGRETLVVSSRMTEDRLIVGLAVATGRPGAERLRGAILSIPEEDRRELEDDEWWPDQLVGLEVLDHEGERRGVVAAIIEGGAQDRLVVETDHGRYEVPFVEALVPVVDVDAGRIVLAEVDGLLSES